MIMSDVKIKLVDLIKHHFTVLLWRLENCRRIMQITETRS
jgi:hypothetical protein